MKAISFIIISFLSSFGDTLFLTGVPLFFFHESGGSIAETGFLPVAITLSVLLARKVIFNLNQAHPVKLTAYGEIAMGVVELLILAVLCFVESKWVILIGTLPLAMIYNVYAPAKFFRIQEYFFGDNVFYLTTWQSAANRFGMLVAVFLSGWVVVRYGIKGILIIDSLSFILFGTFLLSQRNAPIAKSSQSTATNNANNDSIDIKKSTLTFLLPLISLSTLFLNWDRSSAVAVTSYATSLPIDSLSMYKALIGSAGIILGIVISRIGAAASYRAWRFGLIAGTLGVLLLSFNSTIASYFLFFVLGLLSCIAIPVQKLIYAQVTKHGGDDKLVSTGQWIYNSALGLSLIPIGYAAEKSGLLNALQISIILLAVVGILGGFAVLKTLRGVPK